MKLSVIIPARNEEGSIGPTMDTIAARLARDGIAHGDLDAAANRARTSADAQEGRRAMLERRKPAFRGE